MGGRVIGQNEAGDKQKEVASPRKNLPHSINCLFQCFIFPQLFGWSLEQDSKIAVWNLLSKVTLGPLLLKPAFSERHTHMASNEDMCNSLTGPLSPGKEVIQNIERLVFKNCLLIQNTCLAIFPHVLTAWTPVNINLCKQEIP